MLERARRLKWLTLAYASAVVLLIAAADRGVLVVSWLAALPAGDKIGHFVLIGLLSYLANVALAPQGAVPSRRCRRSLSAFRGSLLIGALVVAEEVSQLWIANRAFELADLAADAAGIWFFGMLSVRQRNLARYAREPRDSDSGPLSPVCGGEG